MGRVVRNAFASLVNKKFSTDSVSTSYFSNPVGGALILKFCG